MKPTPLLLRGDARQLPLADGSVQCVITSPPYYGLRDYDLPPLVWDDGWRGSLGLEPTPELYVQHLVQVFRELRRVLRADGTCWLVIGDSFASGEIGRHDRGRPEKGRGWAEYDYGQDGRRQYARPPGLKPKDLCMIPARVALALQADGWWLRSEIIWAKGLSFCAAYAGSVMPESVQDRPTRAHETVFLLTKAERYYYDAEAVREPSSENSHGSPRVNPGPKAGAGGFTTNGQGASFLGRWSAEDRVRGRNLRSVWAINPENFSEAHFATFPQALVTPMVKAGTSEAGACARCGAPWRRVVEIDSRPNWQPTAHTQKHDGAIYRPNIGGGVGNDTRPRRDLGWHPTCACGPEAGRRPCVILDPFAGSGTVPLVAQELGRVGFGVDLKPDYLVMAQRRTAQQVLGLEVPAPGLAPEAFRL